ncbi:PrgI family protein [uncultured archaeon]|nr:PrgI family protein [uncultured archaeon]
MSYEIPAALKYEEKILFGLSLRQALWLGIFGIAGFAIFLKTSFAFEIKAGTGILLALVGAGFAFFDLQTHMIDFTAFARGRKSTGYFDGGMEKFIEVKEIRDDTVLLKNGTAKAVLQVQPINFHMLSQSHKEAIIIAYRDFLNSLDFPIQIAVRTADLSMEDYFEKLGNQALCSKNEKIHCQFREYRGFVEDYIKRKGAKNKMFYVVIPAECPAIGKKIIAEQGTRTIESLNGRVKACQEKLANCNLFTKRLCTQELVTLFAGYFDCLLEAKNDYLSLVTSEESEK